MMVTKGHINVKIDPKRWLNNAIGNSGLRVIELTPEIAMESCNLPGSFHKDPADQIIVTCWAKKDSINSIILNTMII